VVSTTDLDLTSSSPSTPTYRTSAVVTPDVLVLADLAGDSSGGISIRDLGQMAKVMVRCDADSSAAQWLGVNFGQCRALESDALIVGQRPDEYWIIGPDEAVANAASTLADHGVRSSVDLTHGRAMLEISGPKATKMLEKVCGLDWSDAMTPPGSAVSASVAKVSCDIVRIGDSYLVSCDRSFGQYMLGALADAAQEFGLTLDS